MASHWNPRACKLVRTVRSRAHVLDAYQTIDQALCGLLRLAEDGNAPTKATRQHAAVDPETRVRLLVQMVEMHRFPGRSGLRLLWTSLRRSNGPADRLGSPSGMAGYRYLADSFLEATRKSRQPTRGAKEAGAPSLRDAATNWARMHLNATELQSLATRTLIELVPPRLRKKGPSKEELKHTRAKTGLLEKNGSPKPEVFDVLLAIKQYEQENKGTPANKDKAIDKYLPFKERKRKGVLHKLRVVGWVTRARTPLQVTPIGRWLTAKHAPQ